MTALLSLLGFGKMIAQAGLSWLSRRSLIQILCIIACSALFIDHIALLAAHRHERKVETQLAKVVKARADDRAAYVSAQAKAAAQNKARVASVEAQQKRISDERLKDANDRLARLSDELRAHGPAAQSHPDAAGLSPVSKPATGTDGAPGLCLSPDQLLRAAQDEERHDQLITFLEQQSAIDPNKP